MLLPPLTLLLLLRQPARTELPLAGFGGAGGRRFPPALLVCALAAALLSACGSGDDDSGPGGVTAGEARTLDEAAEMLDAQRLPQESVTTPAPEPTASETAADER